MRILRRLCIISVVLGLIVLHKTRESALEWFPFPGSGLMVKTRVVIEAEGEYHLRLSMPIADAKISLEADKPECSLVVGIAGDTLPFKKEPIRNFSPVEEYGFGRLRYFESEKTWQLRPGTYVIEVESQQTPDEIGKRGAMLSLEIATTHPTERFLAHRLYRWVGLAFCLAGLVGLVVCELDWRDQGRK